MGSETLICLMKAAAFQNRWKRLRRVESSEEVIHVVPVQCRTLQPNGSMLKDLRICTVRTEELLQLAAASLHLTYTILLPLLILTRNTMCFRKLAQSFVQP